MPGLPRKASSETLRHVILQNGRGLRTGPLGPFLLPIVQRTAAAGLARTCCCVLRLVFEKPA